MVGVSYLAGLVMSTRVRDAVILGLSIGIRCGLGIRAAKAGLRQHIRQV